MRLHRLLEAGVLGLTLVARGSQAHAQDGSSPAATLPVVRALTILHLGATASVQVAPDVLVGDLVAQASSRSAAAAQRQVNNLMGAGMKAAHAVDGVQARAIGYSVESLGDKAGGWTAQQTLELRGHDGPSLLDLAGRLQERGFATASLDWRLSDAARRKAHDAATIDALKRLQERARDAAAALDLRVDHLQDVRLDDAPAIQPRPGSMVMMAARMATPPQATASPEDVTAEVSADVILRPEQQ